MFVGVFDAFTSKRLCHYRRGPYQRGSLAKWHSRPVPYLQPGAMLRADAP